MATRPGQVRDDGEQKWRIDRWESVAFIVENDLLILEREEIRRKHADQSNRVTHKIDHLNFLSFVRLT